MIILKSLSIRNMATVGNVDQVIRLDAHPVTLILGQNLDSASDEGRNGVGKTTIAQALHYVITGKPMTELSRIDFLINKENEKNMLVTLDFERDGVAYRIERGRKPNVLRFLVGGAEQNVALGENVNTDAEIERIIGMNAILIPHLLLMNTYTPSFLQLKATEQREVIEALFRIDLLSQRDGVLMEQVRATKEAIRDEEATIKATTEANARIEGAITEAKTRKATWVRQQAEKITSLRGDHDALSGLDLDGEAAILDAIAAWVERESVLRRNLEDNEREIVLTNREQASLEAEIKTEAARLLETEAHARTVQRRAQLVQDQGSGSIEQTLELLANRVIEVTQDVQARHDGSIGSVVSKIEQRMARQAEDEERLQGDIAALQAIQATAEEATHSCPECGQDVVDPAHVAVVERRRQDRLAQAEARVLRAHAAVEAHAAPLAALAEDLEGLSAGPSGVAIKPILDAEAALLAATKRADSDRAEVARQVEEAWQASHETDAALADAKAAHALRQVSAAALLDEHGERLRGLRSRRADSTNALTDLGAKPVSGFDSREEIWALRDQLATLGRELAREEEAINPHEAHVASLMTTLAPVLRDALEAHQLRLRHGEFLHKLLTAKDSFLRKRIIDVRLYDLNVRLRGFLDTLGLPFEVTFQSDLSVQIVKFGKEYDFTLLSRGERARLTLALAWSFREIWEGGGSAINLLLIDEMLDNGLDNPGAEAALSIMQRVAVNQGKNVFLISHKDCIISKIDDVLAVVKSDGFTTFCETTA